MAVESICIYTGLAGQGIKQLNPFVYTGLAGPGIKRLNPFVYIRVQLDKE